MKRLLPALLLLGFAAGCGPGGPYNPRDGDLIFQNLLSANGRLIERATGEKYNHVGVVYLDANKQPFVYEAIGPVKLTPLDEWTRRGRDGSYVVKRLREADRYLDANGLERLWDEGGRFEGRPYDPYFEWTNERVYASELAWKMYARALDVRIGRSATLDDLNLSDKVVYTKLVERYGNEIPREEMVVTPGMMFDSDLLVKVYQK